jgi:AcrR family transcriptional regulator
VASSASSLSNPSARASWAGESPLRGAARRRLIEAAGRCIARDGLAATSLSSVAAEAGVSRPTVYRYFADRHTLILATVLDASRELVSDVDDHLRGFDDPHEMAVEAMLYVVRAVPRRPLLDSMWSSTALDAEMLADFTRSEVLAQSREALARLEDAAGWSDAEADDAAEWMLRVLLSLLIAPGPERSDDDLRALLERRLVPALPIRSKANRNRSM